jgi:hypothetical protein
MDAMPAVTRHVGLVLKTNDTTYIPTFCQPTLRDSYLGTYRHSLERCLQDWRTAVGRPKIAAMLFLNTASCIRRARGSAAFVIDTAQYLAVTLGTPLICSNQRKSGLK